MNSEQPEKKDPTEVPRSSVSVDSLARKNAIVLIQAGVRRAVEKAHWIGGGVWALAAGGIVAGLNSKNGYDDALRAGFVETVKTAASFVPILTTFEATWIMAQSSTSPIVRAMPAIVPTTVAVGITVVVHWASGNPNPVLSSLPVMTTAPVLYAVLNWKKNRERDAK